MTLLLSPFPQGCALMHTPSAKKATRLVAGSTAALAAATAAQAQFTGDFANGSPSNVTSSGSTSTSYGNWTFATAESAISWNITTSETAVSLSATSLFASPDTTLVYSEFTLSSPITGTADFDFSFGEFGSARADAGYTIDGGSSWTPFAATSGSLSVAITASQGFGFRVGDNYASANFDSASLTINNFSATAVPEPGSAGLLAGIGALGYVGLVATRRRRLRPSAKTTADS